MLPIVIKSPFFRSMLLACCSLLLVVHSIFEIKDMWYRTRNEGQPKGLLRQHGEYWVWHNYLRAENSFRDNDSITLTTHGTYADLHLLTDLIARWRAPISLSLFVCDSDFDETILELGYRVACDEYLIRKYVSVHLIFHTEYFPKFSNDSVLSWNSNFFKCDQAPLITETSQVTTFWFTYKLKYPINLMRNVARYNAKTYYIMPLDIDLLPSWNFVSEFMSYVSREWNGNPLPRKSVFCLPTFAHKQGAPLALNKRELLTVLRDHKITYPIYNPMELHGKWLNSSNNGNRLSTFMQTSIMDMCVGYVSINALEPLYDELCDMESIYNRRTLLKAKVLEGLKYNFIILDGAFLIRRPNHSWKNIEFDQLELSKTCSVKTWQKLYSDLQVD